MEIITNNQWRNFLYGYELTEKQKQDFDWMELEELETGSFVKYRNRIYSLSEFMRIDHNQMEEFNDYDGYISDSYFSGVLIKVSDCGDCYQIATYIS